MQNPQADSKLAIKSAQLLDIPVKLGAMLVTAPVKPKTRVHVN